MKRKHVVLSIILAVMMVFTALPVTASAGDLLGNLFGGSAAASPVDTKAGIAKRSDGKYDFYKDGVKDPTFNGFVKVNINGREGYYYSENGVIDPNFVGVKHGTINGKTAYYFLDNGGADLGYSGMKKNSKYTWYISNGELQSIVINVPKVNQVPEYPTGCEAAASTSLLNFYGTGTSLNEMIQAIPRENIVKENGKDYGPSIYEKFVGDPKSTYTDEHPGYGAFAPVVPGAMNTVLKKHNSPYRAYNITGSKPSQLYDRVRRGQPVVVWATYNMKTPTKKNSWYVKDPSKPGGEYYFEYPRGTHVMVLVGVDDVNDTITVEDPYGASNKTFDRSLFESKYALLGQMAIEIH